MQTKMGTIEYIPSKNSTFANYPVSGKLRTPRFQCSSRCSWGVCCCTKLYGIGWQQINADRL